VIAYFLGAVSVGIYAAAYSIGSIALMLAGILGFVLPPTLSKLYDEGRMAEVKTLLNYSLKYMLLLVIPFVCGAAVLSKQVLGLFSTGEIAAHGYPIVPVVALASSFLCIGIPFEMILTLVKKTKIIGLAYALSAAVNIALNLLVVPVWGIFAAAVTTLVGYTLLVAIEVFFSLKEFRFDISWSSIVKSMAAAAVMTVVIWLMHPQGAWNTIITVLVGAAVYAAGLFLLKTFTRQEISFYMGFFRRRDDIID